jgi:acetyl esterase/lipase
MTKSSVLRRWVGLSAALLLSGCSAGGTLAAFEPTGGGKATRNIVFAAGPRGTLDVFAPKAGAAGRPVVVFFYGGGFRRGEKSMYSFVGKALQAHGYLAVVPDYRLYPEVRYQGFLSDGAKAVRWARDHAAEYGGDPSKIVLMGHSAGGYIAAMLAVDPRWLGEVGMDPRRDVSAWVGLAGGYGDPSAGRTVRGDLFGGPEEYDSTRPGAHVEKASPPALLIAGDGDKVVDPANVDRLAASIHAVGGRVEARRYPRLGHLMTVGAFAAPLRFWAPVYRDAVSFIDAVTGFNAGAS